MKYVRNVVKRYGEGLECKNNTVRSKIRVKVK